MTNTTRKVFGKAPKRRESYHDYMGRRMREERHKGGDMVDRTLAETEIASMQEQVHLLQMRVKELTETVYFLSRKISILGGNSNQLELKF